MKLDMWNYKSKVKSYHTYFQIFLYLIYFTDFKFFSNRISIRETRVSAYYPNFLNLYMKKFSLKYQSEGIGSHLLYYILSSTVVSYTYRFSIVAD